MAVSPFMAQGIKLLSFSRPPSSSSPSSSSPRLLQRNFRPTSVKASIAPEECNKEDFAPNKEVEKVSMEWVAEDKTKVVGTYPPVSREQKLSWTGYIEKDTAGQTNIYPVEPTVYVAESAISSGAAGSSADGSESVLTLSLGICLTVLYSILVVLTEVGKNGPVEEMYVGPSLSEYIEKFEPAKAVQATAPNFLVVDEVPSETPTLETS